MTHEKVFRAIFCYGHLGIVLAYIVVLRGLLVTYCETFSVSPNTFDE